MKEKIQKIRQNKLIQKHKAKIKFVLVGGTNFLLDLSIYTLLANVLGWNQIVANVKREKNTTYISEVEKVEKLLDAD